MKDFTIEINGRTLEFFDDEHLYLVDGVIVPSITRILAVRFGKKYEGVDKVTLQRAADRGNAVHEAIEAYCKDGTESELPEVRNFKFLQKAYGFEVISNEVPVIFFKDNAPIAAGRLDLVLKMGETVGGADIKRTSALDKEYLAYQLNLYRIAFKQCYGIEWEFLRGIHLRGEETRKYVTLPIDEGKAWELVNEFMERVQ